MHGIYRMLLLFFVAAAMTMACTETKTKVVETVVEKPGTTNNSGLPNDPTTTPVTVEGGGAVLTKDIIGPRVIATNPANEFQEVSPSSAVHITFTESIDPASVSTDTIQLKDSGGNVMDGTLSYQDESKTATIMPSAPFLDSEQYTVSVSTGIRDLAGNEKPVDDSLVFRVADLKTDAIAMGGGYILALKENKTVWAWGRNQFGQLGDGTMVSRNHPVHIKGLSNVTAIAAYNGNSYALAGGAVWAWGSNSNGQIGDGTTTNRLTPFKVPNLDNVIAIAAANAACFALKSDGTVWGWGSNRTGVLGDGTGTGDNTDHDSPVPVRVLIDAPVTQISGGAGFVMALTQDPTTKETSVWTWGAGGNGQLGNKTAAYMAAKPVQVLDPTGNTPLHGIAKINATTSQAMALTDTGEVLSWGQNVGDGTTTNRSLPVTLAGLPKMIHLSGGTGASGRFAITEDGQLWGWGKNTNAQLFFYSASGIELAPKVIGMISQVVDAQTDGSASAILFKDGSVVTSGYNLYGQLGHGTASYYSFHPNPTLFPAATHVSGRLVAAKDGTVWAMGRNVDCELGLPKHGSEVMVPMQIAIPAKVVQVANSGMHMLALDENGNVWAWGSNSHGQLGNGTVGGTSCIPQKVKSPDGNGVLDNVASIAAGVPVEFLSVNMFGNSMAIRKIPGDPDGAKEVLAWGNNNNGQLGVAGSVKTTSPLPIKVGGLPSNVKQMAVTDHVMAVTDDGAVWGWGGGGWGQLCNGSKTGGPTPQLISIPNAKQVASGATFSLILLNDGTIKSCGNNYRGQLGVGWGSYLAADQTVAVQTVQGISDATFVAANGYVSMAITKDKQLWGWGANGFGQLGTMTAINQYLPAKTMMKNGESFSDVSEVSIYLADFLPDASSVVTAVRSDGSVWDWGYLSTPFTYLIREGESAFSPPQTVNWP